MIIYTNITAINGNGMNKFTKKINTITKTCLQTDKLNSAGDLNYLPLTKKRDMHLLTSYQ